MTPPQLATLGEVVAFLVGLGVIVAGLKWLVPIVRGAWRGIVGVVRGVRDFLDSWHGRPPTYDAHGTLVDPGHPGVLGRLLGYDTAIAGMTTGLAAIREELVEHAEAIADVQHHGKPNSGTSAYDAIVRRLDDNRALLAAAIAEIGELRRDYERALRHNHPDYNPHAYSD